MQMALREEGAAGGPQFEDLALPCLQILFLGTALADGTFATIDTYQKNAVCGLRLRQAAIDRSVGWTGIYRLRELPELPVGGVESVSTFLDEGVLAEVLLRAQPVRASSSAASGRYAALGNSEAVFGISRRADAVRSIGRKD